MIKKNTHFLACCKFFFDEQRSIYRQRRNKINYGGEKKVHNIKSNIVNTFFLLLFLLFVYISCFALSFCDVSDNALCHCVRDFFKSLFLAFTSFFPFLRAAWFTC